MMNNYNLRKKLGSAAAICALALSGIVFSPMSVSAQSRGYSDSSSAAAMEIRFQKLEKEIRRLTGQVEEQNYEIRRLRADLERVSGDVSVRFNDINGGQNAPSIAPAVGGNSPAANANVLGTINKSPDTGVISPSDGASHAYEYAYSLVKARNFDRAEAELAKFMKKYPDHSLVSNAKYWYGETFYVRKDYEKAARAFAEGYQKFPKGPKAASNLLKLGMSLKGMGKVDDACVAYKQLKKDYAKSSIPVLKRAETEMRRINCK